MAVFWPDWLMLTLLSSRLSAPEMMGIRIRPIRPHLMPPDSPPMALQGVWIRSMPRKW